MKKIIAMLLAIVMVCALSVSVFAATDNVTDKGANPYDVTATWTQDENIPVYSVDITWDSLVFAFEQDPDTWDEENYEWDENLTGSWGAKTTANLTVLNKSSEKLDAQIGVAKVVNTITISTNTELLKLNGGEGADAATATGTAVITIGGYMTEAAVDNKIATVTITLVDGTYTAG